MKEPKFLHRGPGWLKEWLNELLLFAVQTQPLPGIGVTVNDGPAGRMINAGRVGTSASGDHPFQVVAGTEAGDIKVNLYSYLFKNLY